VSAPRFQLADELLRRLAASLRSAQLYSAGHPIISRNLESLSSAFQLLHSLQPIVVVGIVGDEVIVDDMPMAKADTLGPLIRRLQQSGVERITVDRGVTSDELAAFIQAITTIEGRTAGPGDQPPEFPAIPHIRVGRGHPQIEHAVEFVDELVVPPVPRPHAILQRRIQRRPFGKALPQQVPFRIVMVAKGGGQRLVVPGQQRGPGGLGRPHRGDQRRQHPEFAAEHLVHQDHVRGQAGPVGMDCGDGHGNTSECGVFRRCNKDM